MASGEVELDKAAVQKSDEEHLARLGLLAPRRETDTRSPRPFTANVRQQR
jgi:hypothetical protein